MLPFRPGHKKKRPKLTMSPELVVEANRMLGGKESESDAALTSRDFGPEAFAFAFASRDFVLITARRTEELRQRGYPEDWIERDLKELLEGL